MSISKCILRVLASHLISCAGEGGGSQEPHLEHLEGRGAGAVGGRGPAQPASLHFRRAPLGAVCSPVLPPRARSPLGSWPEPRLREPGSARPRARVVGMAGSGWGPPRLDGFILTERLGSGTYATVYKAYAKVGAGRLGASVRGSSWGLENF